MIKITKLRNFPEWCSFRRLTNSNIELVDVKFWVGRLEFGSGRLQVWKWSTSNLEVADFNSKWSTCAFKWLTPIQSRRLQLGSGRLQAWKWSTSNLEVVHFNSKWSTSNSQLVDLRCEVVDLKYWTIVHRSSNSSVSTLISPNKKSRKPRCILLIRFAWILSYFWYRNLQPLSTWILDSWTEMGLPWSHLR